jgi:hypothetical protein
VEASGRFIGRIPGISYIILPKVWQVEVARGTADLLPSEEKDTHHHRSLACVKLLGAVLTHLQTGAREYTRSAAFRAAVSFLGTKGHVQAMKTIRQGFWNILHNSYQRPAEVLETAEAAHENAQRHRQLSSR